MAKSPAASTLVRSVSKNEVTGVTKITATLISFWVGSSQVIITTVIVNRK